MATNPFSGMGTEFANWQSLPSISEAFAKAAGGQFNPIVAAVGYGLDKAMGGDNEYISNLMKKQKEAFNQQGNQPLAPSVTQPVEPKVGIQSQAPAVPGVPSVGVNEMDKFIPSYSNIKSKINNLFGVQ